MTHFTSDELIDAVDGILAPERRAHLAGCDTCRRQVDDLSSALAEARQVSVPEPSPLFWGYFAERVREAIVADPAGAWPSWLRWQVLAPIGALAIAVLVLALNIQRPPHVAEQAGGTASPAATLAADNWATVAELVGPIDLDLATATGVITPGVADRAVLVLTAEEQQELSRLLQAELTRAKS